jgi:Brp/Blh family beta-carotene 15,15'-monooxygenase
MNRNILKNYQNFKIYFTFLMIWISIQFGNVVEDFIGYLLVISIGILHGANDLLILSVKEKVNFFNKKNLFVYLTVVLFCVLLFLIESYLTMIIFILISSYHFGEEHFNEEICNNKWLDIFYFSSYGLFLFSILFYFSSFEVKKIMIELTGTYFEKSLIYITFLISGILFILLNTYLIIIKKINSIQFFKELFFILLIAIVFANTSLILGFAVYFIFWHSMPSILNQIKFISGDFTKKNILYYFKKGIIYWIISILGLLILYYFFKNTKLLNSIVFVILFAVTAPHIWVMYKMKS